MAPLTELNKVSIAQIIVYTPALAVAILLAVRHGFGRSSGWFYVILFSVVRILGGALQLATINDPTNLGLLVGASTLQSIGLSPLILVMLGLLNRVLTSIRQTHDTVITPRMIRLVQIVVMVGLILGIVGGSELGGIISDAIASGNLDYTMPTESVAGMGLMIAGFGLLVVASAMTATQLGTAEPGEKRILLAIGLATPFVLVRLIFSAMATFTHNRDFRSFGGTAKYPDLLIGMAVVMEMCAVVILEAIGLTLQKAARPAVASGRMENNILLGSRGRHSRSPSKDEHEAGVQRV
jgi:hypothetical protein